MLCGVTVTVYINTVLLVVMPFYWLKKVLFRQTISVHSINM